MSVKGNTDQSIIQAVIETRGEFTMHDGTIYSYKQLILKKYSITEADLFTFKFPGFNADQLKKNVGDIINEYYPKITEAWKVIFPAADSATPSILKHNNDPDGDGRHISPGLVNIASTITVNLVCNATNGSYQVNLEKSRQAQQGYIL